MVPTIASANSRASVVPILREGLSHPTGDRPGGIEKGLKPRRRQSCKPSDHGFPPRCRQGSQGGSAQQLSPLTVDHGKANLRGNERKREPDRNRENEPVAERKVSPPLAITTKIRDPRLDFNNSEPVFGRQCDQIRPASVWQWHLTQHSVAKNAEQTRRPLRQFGRFLLAGR